MYKLLKETIPITVIASSEFYIFDPWQGYTPQCVCAKPQNVLHSQRGMSCASNFRRTEYFSNTGNWWDPHGGSKTWSCLN